MSNEIIKVLDALAEKLGIAVDWTEQNVLPYAQMLCEKYIKYEIATSVLWIIIAIILLVLGIAAWKYVDNYEDDDDFDMFVAIFSIVLLLSAFVMIPLQTLDIIECLTFPEKMIFEYLRSIKIS